MSDAQRQFLVLSLPRSRSAWMAHYLRYGGAAVGHDTLIECSSIGEFTGQFTSGKLRGSCETGAVLGWRLLSQLLPGVKVVTVSRDPGEVAASFAAKGLLVDGEELEARAAMLELVSKQPGVLAMEYDDLVYPEACAALFEFCLQQPFDSAWWAIHHETNIQVEFPARIARLRERAPMLAAIKAEAIEMTRRAPLCHLN